MKNYRFYVMSAESRIVSATVMDCADDLAALEHAQAILDGHDIEIWDGARLLTRLKSDGEAKLPLPPRS